MLATQKKHQSMRPLGDIHILSHTAQNRGDLEHKCSENILVSVSLGCSDRIPLTGRLPQQAFLTVLEAEKSKIKELADSVSTESSPAVFSHLHMQRETDRQSERQKDNKRQRHRQGMSKVSSYKRRT